MTPTSSAGFVTFVIQGENNYVAVFLSRRSKGADIGSGARANHHMTSLNCCASRSSSSAYLGLVVTATLRAKNSMIPDRYSGAENLVFIPNVSFQANPWPRNKVLRLCEMLEVENARAWLSDGTNRLWAEDNDSNILAESIIVFLHSGYYLI